MRKASRHPDRAEQRRGLVRIVITDLRRDTALGLRLLGTNRGFTAIAVLMLALGIGANTAIYSVLDAVLLRPLPYPEPDRLVLVSETLENGNPNSTSGGAFMDWRTHQRGFQALALTGRVAQNLRGDGAPERLTGMEVSHEFLDVLGIPPLLGRGFLPDEDRPGGRTDVVMLTEELWRSRFAADPAIVGHPIVLDEVRRTVVGVLPRDAWIFREDSFFVPAVLEPGSSRASRREHWAAVFGRLAPGTSVPQAQAEIASIKRRLNSEYPGYKQRWGVAVRPVTDVIGGLARTRVAILLAAVALVLLIACANVTSLLLARGSHRRHELAVRAALGASGGRLVRQMLTENLVLAGLGGAVGVGIAYLGVDVLRRLALDAAPIAFTLRLDTRVLLFSLAITLLTGPIVGLLPALRARRTDVGAALNTGSKGAPSGASHRTQSLIVVAEVAFTVILLASAGLLLRSLAVTASSDPGFDPGRVLAFDVSLPDASYPTREKRLAFATELVARLRGLPGVQAAGTGMALPFSGGGYGEFFNRPGAAESQRLTGRMDFVSPGYLEALGTRLMAGRYLSDADNRLDGPRVVVINDYTRRRFFPAGEAIGQQLIVRGQAWQVVGVIADVVDRRLDVPRGPFAYVPAAFNVSRISVAVRTPLDPMSLLSGIRTETARLDPGVAIAAPRALDRAMADSMIQRRLVLGLVLTFALAALLLAAVGLYGVMTYTVAARRREFGIRMAMGATRRDLLQNVLRGGLRVTAIGLMLGLPGSVAVARLMESELYQVRASDPAVLVCTGATVAFVALLACWIPAWQASTSEPTAALRAD
jgi:predicted permease